MTDCLPKFDVPHARKASKLVNHPNIRSDQRLLRGAQGLPSINSNSRSLRPTTRVQRRSGPRTLPAFLGRMELAERPDLLVVGNGASPAKTRERTAQPNRERATILVSKSRKLERD